MRAEARHTEGYAFEAQFGDHKFFMDALPPLGTNKGPSPKQVLLASILGCTGMDVVGLLRKHKVAYKALNLAAESETTDKHPKTFRQVDVTFELTGDGLAQDKIIESIDLSMTKYCGVSAMVTKAAPIFYTVSINGEIVHRAQARFPDANS